ncbi:nucleotidyl transferase AbiEii/AbiGii toxin family protein, partial [Jannaschia formosa]|uniref:nucleotidyl transferase AbiEii/AbiGii toxin family protein n=1 Tax=Jannaschia formosa TaxID=2259592 RepID=UPI001ADD8E20
MDADLLQEAKACFGGGTAISLLLDEYRESVGIDFLCADLAGYRLLRNVSLEGIAGLFESLDGMEQVRDVRSDRDGIRTAMRVGDIVVKFEIVLEGRIPLSGARNATLGVPVLDRESLFAEKLLANDDRWADRGTMNRDIIDLAMMISRWGPVPDTSRETARGAYGKRVDESFGKAADRISDLDWLERCMRDMSMDEALSTVILDALGRS